MSKKDLLDILYAERSRLNSIYSRPGWTSWAIWGTIISLAWSQIDSVLMHSFPLRISFAIFYTLFNASLIIVGIYKTLHQSPQQPLWQKGRTSIRFALGCFFFIYLSQLIALIRYKSLLEPVWLFYIALIINILTIALILLNFVLSYKELLRTQRINIYEGIIEAFLRMSFVILWILFIINQTSVINIESIKAGLILFAIVILFICLDDSTIEKIKDLDKLIDKTLFEENIEEKYVFSELEKCIIGLKYSNFLIKENYDNVLRQTKLLYNSLSTLNDMVNGFTEYNTSIRYLVDSSIKQTQRIRPTIDSLIKMIKLGYDETNIDSSLSPLIQLMEKSLELMSIWVDVGNKMSEYNYKEFQKYVGIKYEEANLLYAKLNSCN